VVLDHAQVERLGQPPFPPVAATVLRRPTDPPIAAVFFQPLLRGKQQLLAQANREVRSALRDGPQQLIAPLARVQQHQVARGRCWTNRKARVTSPSFSGDSS
jgi:hypothetical protein